MGHVCVRGGECKWTPAAPSIIIITSSSSSIIIIITHVPPREEGETGAEVNRQEEREETG
jgi:hypothetical protein